jgi:hypothetical protein
MKRLSNILFIGVTVRTHQAKIGEGLKGFGEQWKKRKTLNTMFCKMYKKEIFLLILSLRR